MWSLFFFKQKTAYEMRISDWSSDVCSSDLQMWVVSSHDALLEMLKDNRFSTSYKHWEHAPTAKPFEQQNHFERAIDAGLFVVDPKEHLRLRKLTMPAFRSAVLRVGKEGVSTFRSRESLYYSKKN